jgi:hypothetical protein
MNRGHIPVIGVNAVYLGPFLDGCGGTLEFVLAKKK